MDAGAVGCSRSKLEAEAAERRLRPCLFSAKDDDQEETKPGHHKDGEDEFILEVVQERLKCQEDLPPNNGQPSALGKGQRETSSPKKMTSVGILTPHSVPDNQHQGPDLPMVTLAGQHVNRRSLPGAVAVSGPCPEFDEEAATTSSSSSTPPGGAASTPGHNENELVVANMVTDIPTSNLPHAQGYDEQHRGSRATEQAKQGKITLFVFTVVVLVITIVIVITTVLQPQKNNNAETKVAGADPPINASTAAPSTSVDESVLSLFPAATITRIQEDSQSSQARAFKWLMEDTDNLPSLSNERIAQKFSLATLYYSMGGADWNINTNWLNHSINECNWLNHPTFARSGIDQMYTGFMATLPLPTANTTCNDDGVYQHLWLIQNNLVGALPEEIYLLTGLVTLSLGWNPQLQGTISTLLGRLSALKAHGLNRVSLSNSASIPKEIGSLRNLHTILLGGAAMHRGQFQWNFGGSQPWMHLL